MADFSINVAKRQSIEVCGSTRTHDSYYHHFRVDAGHYLEAATDLFRELRLHYPAPEYHLEFTRWNKVGTTVEVPE